MWLVSQIWVERFEQPKWVEDLHGWARWQEYGRLHLPSGETLGLRHPIDIDAIERLLKFYFEDLD